MLQCPGQLITPTWNCALPQCYYNHSQFVKAIFVIRSNNGIKPLNKNVRSFTRYTVWTTSGCPWYAWNKIRWAVYTQVSFMGWIPGWQLLVFTSASIHVLEFHPLNPNFTSVILHYGYCFQNSSQWPFVSSYRACKAQFYKPLCMSSNIPMSTI